MNEDRRLIEWLDLTADFLQLPLPEFPRAQIGWQLTRTFDVLAVSWDWRDGEGHSGSETWPVDRRLSRGRPAVLAPGPHHPAAPARPWFVTTQDPSPQSIGRVPRAIASKHDSGAHRHLPTDPSASDQQLSIPYLISGQSYRAFVLGRPDDEFSDDDLALARKLQHLIRGIYLHSSLVEQIPTQTDACVAAAHAGLTATELAVLILLSEGRTAYAIGRRLDISPRTAQKHLEHIYRKLGVADRLGAVLAAREGGLVPLAAAPTAGPIPEQRAPI